MPVNTSLSNRQSLKTISFIGLLNLVLLLISKPLYAQELEAVQVYSQDKLIELINQNEHLQQIKADRCQIVEDIEARAEIMRVPAYQFLWGDMLAWGVCVDRNPAHGINYMQQAADQGFPAALEQVGRYYAQGQFVQKDLERAVIFLREASALGSLKAQMQLAQLFISGYGSPYDYQDLYHWLYNAVSGDDVQHRKIANYLQDLESLMHPRAVRLAKRSASNSP